MKTLTIKFERQWREINPQIPIDHSGLFDCHRFGPRLAFSREIIYNPVNLNHEITHVGQLPHSGGMP
jgi:hypothetical protein